MQREEWRDIKGYEGLYQVSNLGRVKSLASGRRARNIRRRDGNTRDDVWNRKERILQYVWPGTGKTPYVHLHDAKGRRKSVAVKRLVAEAFLGLKKYVPTSRIKVKTYFKPSVTNISLSL